MSGRRDVQHPPELLALKVATRALVRAVGGTDAAAITLGSRQQRISDCCNPNTPDFLRIDEVQRLEEVAQHGAAWPQVTLALARHHDHDLCRRPVAPIGNADLLKLVAEHARENGEIAGAILSALADGHVSPAEAVAAIAQVDDQISVAVAMRAQLRMIEAEGGR